VYRKNGVGAASQKKRVGRERTAKEGLLASGRRKLKK